MEKLDNWNKKQTDFFDNLTQEYGSFDFARESCDAKKQSEKFINYFDLAAENKRQLVDAGVTWENIIDCGLCTVCEDERFYSFRKEKDDSGRMISFICK